MLQSLSRTLLAASLTFGAVTAFADYRIIDQTSSDTTLLRAYATSQKLSDVIPADQVPEVCDFVGNGEYSAKSYNCTAELTRRLGVPFVASEYRQILKVAPSSFEEGLRYLDGAGERPIAYIETASREAAFASAGAYGIYWDMGGYYLIIGKDRMSEVGRVTLKDGSAGLVHRFAVPFETTGFGGSGPIRYISFKPFIDFHVPEQGVLYRNWDSAPGSGWWTNYWLGSGYEPYRPDRLWIDRSADVIQ